MGRRASFSSYVPLCAVSLCVSACAEVRETTRSERCYDYRSEIEPRLFASCGECHGGGRAQGGVAIDTFRGVIAQVAVGDMASPLLAAARGAAGHPTADATTRDTLTRWVVECRASHFATDAVHPVAWAMPGDASFHGEALAATNYDFDACAECHADPNTVDGGSSGRSCTACHPGGAATCSTCHGSEASSAPPRALDGSTDVSRAGVGAHAVHVLGGPTLGLQLDCTECHPEVVAIDDPGHIDEPPAEVVFGLLANASIAGLEGRRAGGAQYDHATGTCSNVYCHGSVLGDPARGDVSWTDGVSDEPSCDGCHQAVPQTPGHPDWPTSDACQQCHGGVVDAELNLLNPALHMDGALHLGDGSGTCSACHGSETNAAPPAAVDGAVQVADRGVGLHQRHVTGGEKAAAIPCSACHSTPSGESFIEQVIAVGHIDTGSGAQVQFDGVAVADSANATYFADTGTCTVYCHGSGEKLAADATTTIEREVVWTSADTSLGCAGCHGVPPDDGVHPSSLLCHVCHGDTVDESFTIQFSDDGTTKHINGEVDTP